MNKHYKYIYLCIITYYLENTNDPQVELPLCVSLIVTARGLDSEWALYEFDVDGCRVSVAA
jgi:hypothetical protein